MHSDIFSYYDAAPSSVTDGGILAGKAAVIQPNMSVHGWPTEAGAKALEGFAALEDATAVERLKQAGALLKGSTRMAELGFGLYDDTAWKALTDKLTDIALVTDTMGEARIAASHAGAFGYKPSHGIVSRYGLIGLIPSMECYGILAHTPDEIARTAQAITGRDDNDPSMTDDDIPDFSQVTTSLSSVKTAGVITECIESLEPGELNAFNNARLRLEKQGITIIEMDFPDYELYRTVHHVTGSVEASSSAGKYDSVRYGHRADTAKNWNEMYIQSRAESFGETVKIYLFQGAYFQFENYPAFENACRIRRRLLEKTLALFDSADVLISPTRKLTSDAFSAVSVPDIYDAFSLTLCANAAGLPAVQVPGLAVDSDTDTGLQFIGPRLSDVGLLSFASFISNEARGGE